MRISDWSSDVCSSDLQVVENCQQHFTEKLRIGFVLLDEYGFEFNQIHRCLQIVIRAGQARMGRGTQMKAAAIKRDHALLADDGRQGRVYILQYRDDRFGDSCKIGSASCREKV